jgi:hypothetical protein
MPAVSGRFKTYRDFASASLTDIYGVRLAEAFLVTANHLESGVWLNETGKGGDIAFRWQALPQEAQLSPVNAIASGDFNGDGSTEVVLAQNHYTNQAETGLWRGNPGCHLEWGENGFETIPHQSSGIVMPNDTKAILSIDADGDGMPDILAGQNDDILLLFRNTKR